MVDGEGHLRHRLSEGKKTENVAKRLFAVISTYPGRSRPLSHSSLHPQCSASRLQQTVRAQ